MWLLLHVICDSLRLPGCPVFRPCDLSSLMDLWKGGVVVRMTVKTSKFFTHWTGNWTSPASIFYLKYSFSLYFGERTRVCLCPSTQLNFSDGFCGHENNACFCAWGVMSFLLTHISNLFFSFSYWPFLTSWFFFLLLYFCKHLKILLLRSCKNCFMSLGLYVVPLASPFWSFIFSYGL